MGFRFVKGAAACLATIGMMVPQARILADAPPPKPEAGKTPQINHIPDLILTEGGTMTGRVCDKSGKVIEGTKVVLKQDNKVIGTTMTNKDGVYSFKNLKGGIYSPSAGNTEGVFRAWSEKTAPPSAKGHALLVMGENGARGQFGSVDPTLILLTAGVIAGVTVGALALSKINQVSDQVNNINASP